MNNPEVSVILPVYNASRTLSDAIKSILSQTFTDLELIIVNDGSTDNSQEVIEQFKDKRLRYYSNDTNKGLIYSLNRGIDLSTGNYIARMDSDDIAVPHRIEQQVEFMRRNKNVDLCASTIIIIDKSGKKGGTWDLDQRTLRHNQIRRSMAVENCIAHPTVLAKAQIFKENKYDTAQVNMEDYGLWLRLISKGYRFEKIGEPLLLYRVHENSITSTTLKDKNFFFRHARLKRRFAWTELRSGRWNSFVFAVLASVLVDAAKGTVKLLKNR